MSCKINLSILVLALGLSSCYSFSGISIDADISTFNIDNFQNNAPNSVPSLAQNFTEDLKNKVRTETRLIENNREPDIEFKGTIVDYRVTSEAPQPGETASINRLTINIAIEYIHHKDEEKGWKSNFSHFFDFPSSTDLSSIQEAAIEEITEQLMEDIFNKAFTDW